MPKSRMRKKRVPPPSSSKNGRCRVHLGSQFGGRAIRRGALPVPVSRFLDVCAAWRYLRVEEILLSRVAPGALASPWAARKDLIGLFMWKVIDEDRIPEWFSANELRECLGLKEGRTEPLSRSLRVGHRVGLLAARPTNNGPVYSIKEPITWEDTDLGFGDRYDFGMLCASVILRIEPLLRAHGGRVELGKEIPTFSIIGSKPEVIPLLREALKEWAGFLDPAPGAEDGVIEYRVVAAPKRKRADLAWAMRIFKARWVELGGKRYFGWAVEF